MLFLLLAAAAIVPAVTTEPVANDPDDPAVWVRRDAPEQSLILATDKAAAPNGALYVFGLDGKVIEKIEGLDRPNNVDVEYGLGGRYDIAVITERNKNRIRVYRISPTKPHLVEMAALPTFEAPMGVALYKKGAEIYVILSRKRGPTEGYLWQYQLILEGEKLRLRKTLEFGRFSGGEGNEIEAVTVDDRRNVVYYSDESCCIRAYEADTGLEIGFFGDVGFERQREGLALYKSMIVATDQIPNGSAYHVFDTKGRRKTVLKTDADSTDGIEVVDRSLGSRFPEGVLIVMNSKAKNFLLFDWRDVKRAASGL